MPLNIFAVCYHTGWERHLEIESFWYSDVLAKEKQEKEPDLDWFLTDFSTEDDYDPSVYVDEDIWEE